MPTDVPTDEFLPIFGENVERERERCGLSQEQVAERLGIDCRTYQRYTKGKVNVPLGRVRRLAQVFGCSMDTLTREGKEGQ